MCPAARPPLKALNLSAPCVAATGDAGVAHHNADEIQRGQPGSRLRWTEALATRMGPLGHEGEARTLAVHLVKADPVRVQVGGIRMVPTVDIASVYRKYVQYHWQRPPVL